MSASSDPPVPEVEIRGGRNKRGGGDSTGAHARNLGGGSGGSDYGVRRSEYGFAQDGHDPDGEEQTAAMRQQRRRRAQERDLHQESHFLLRNFTSTIYFHVL